MIGVADAGALGEGVPIMLQKPEHGNFGVAFDPSSVVRYPIGEVNIKLGCSDGAGSDYSGENALFPDVMQTLEKLAGYVDSPCP